MMRARGVRREATDSSQVCCRVGSLLRKQLLTLLLPSAAPALLCSFPLPRRAWSRLRGRPRGSCAPRPFAASCAPDARQRSMSLRAREGRGRAQVSVVRERAVRQRRGRARAARAPPSEPSTPSPASHGRTAPSAPRKGCPRRRPAPRTGPGCPQTRLQREGGWWWCSGRGRAAAVVGQCWGSRRGSSWGWLSISGRRAIGLQPCSRPRPLPLRSPSSSTATTSGPYSCSSSGIFRLNTPAAQHASRQGGMCGQRAAREGRAAAGRQMRALVGEAPGQGSRTPAPSLFNLSQAGGAPDSREVLRSARSRSTFWEGGARGERGQRVGRGRAGLRQAVGACQQAATRARRRAGWLESKPGTQAD